MANEITQDNEITKAIAQAYVNPESNSVIGISNGFSGEFHSDGLLRIDGDFKGVIKGKGVVLLGEKGRVIGDIYARQIRIGGRLMGNVYAMEKVELLSTGKLMGDFYSPRFFAEEGMVFTGQGKTISQDEIKAIFKERVEKVSPIIDKEI